MKAFMLGICITLVTSASALADGMHAKLVGFAAPSVNGTSSVYLPELGAIVYDESTTSFYGYNSSSWTLLGGSAQTVPSGVVQAYAGSSTPTGYLVCDGSAVSRTTYAALFTAIGTTYGAGDGSTTFNLPNAQGVFLRGAGSQTISSITYSATLGHTQGDQMQGHIHDFNVTNIAAFAGTGSLDSSSTSGSRNYDLLGSGVSSPVSDGTNGTPRTGAETRPANLSITYIIKT